MYWIRVLLLFSVMGCDAATFEYGVNNTRAEAKVLRISMASLSGSIFSNVEDLRFDNGEHSISVPPFYSGRLAIRVTAQGSSELRDPNVVLSLPVTERSSLKRWLDGYSGYRYREGYGIEDCNGAAALLAEIAQRQGYRAQPVVGLVYQPGRDEATLLHAWVKIHIDQKWVDVDVFSIDKDKSHAVAAVFGDMSNFSLNELIQ